jgi:hypothetical protein
VRKNESQPTVTVRRAPNKSSAREVWHINQKGETRTVVTSGTSAKALDRAMTRFDAALKLLADR